MALRSGAGDLHNFHHSARGAELYRTNSEQTVRTIETQRVEVWFAPRVDRGALSFRRGFREEIKSRLEDREPEAWRHGQSAKRAAVQDRGSP